MRIDAYSNVGMVYKANQKPQIKKTNKTSQTEDKFEISQAGKDYQTAKTAVAASSDIREDVVAAVKAKYNGKYEVSAEDFAAKLAEKYNTTLF